MAKFPRDIEGDDYPEPSALLTPAEVASMFHVDAKTVSRWADAGKLSSIRTLGGHRRFRYDQVIDLIEKNSRGIRE